MLQSVLVIFSELGFSEGLVHSTLLFPFKIMKHGVLLYKFTAFRDILDLITRNSCIQLINLKLVSKTNLLLVLTFYDIFSSVTSGEVRRSLEIC